MATKKQILANRANARRSTGPATTAGKSRASANAIKHGLTSKRILIAGEDPAQLEVLWNDVSRELAPKNALERGLRERLVSAFWRLRRIGSFEANVIAARVSEVTITEIKTEREWLKERMAEISLRYLPQGAERQRSNSEKPETNPEIDDATKLFWRKVGVALTRDSRLLNALTNLSRRENELLTRIALNWRFLDSASPTAMAKRENASRLNAKRGAKSRKSSSVFVAKTIVVGDEDPAHFETMRRELIEQYAPCTRIECELVDYIAVVFWRLERLLALEASSIDALRKQVAPEEIDPEEKAREDKEFHELSAKLLPSNWRSALPPEYTSVGEIDSKHEKQSVPIVGLVLLKDCWGEDTLGKLARHEAALTNALGSALKLLSTMRLMEQAEQHKSTD